MIASIMVFSSQYLNMLGSNIQDSGQVMSLRRALSVVSPAMVWEYFHVVLFNTLKY